MVDILPFPPRLRLVQKLVRVPCSECRGLRYVSLNQFDGDVTRCTECETGYVLAEPEDAHELG